MRVSILFSLLTGSEALLQGHSNGYRMRHPVSLQMGLTLYGSQGSRSPLVNWAAYELNLPLDMGNLAVNPHPFGQIPSLTDGDDVVVFESGAILLYLNGLKNQKLTPSQEGQILSWVTWANASLDPICFLETPEGKVYDTGLKKPNRRMDNLDEILSKQEYLIPNEFTVADVAVSSYLLYVLQFFPGVSLARWPHIVKYLQRCATRESYGKAFGKNVQSYFAQSLSDMTPEKPNKLFGMF